MVHAFSFLLAELGIAHCDGLGTLACSFVNYWREPGLRCIAGGLRCIAGGSLAFVFKNVLLLCAFVFMVESVYNVSTFANGYQSWCKRIVIVALRNGTKCSTYRLL